MLFENKLKEKTDENMLENCLEYINCCFYKCVGLNLGEIFYVML